MLIAFGSLLTACAHRVDPQKLSGDERLRKQLVGVWHFTNGDADGFFSFNLDGSATGALRMAQRHGHPN